MSGGMKDTQLTTRGTTSKKIDKARGMPHTEDIPTRSKQIACREDP